MYLCNGWRILMENKIKNDSTNNILVNPAEFVVGIGGSAGSLHALENFFKNIKQETEGAFILVQHLSDDFKSIVGNILAKHCHLTIKVAKDLETIEKGTLYILDQRKYLTVGDGRIILSEIESKSLHFPIDYFFKSLAEAYQNHAIGVILSGTGSDGSNGFSSLNSVGATLYCQSAEDAEFDGMPLAAINLGRNVHINNAALLGVLVNDKLEKLHQSSIEPRNNTYHQDEIEEIFTLVKNAAKIDLSEYKLSTVERRIEHRMGVLEIPDLALYTEYIKREESELILLAQDIMIGVTQFFRDPDVWEYVLETVVKPLLITKPKDELIRVWVPGCASGEEAFTLSMLFEYAKEQLNCDRTIKIFASDISKNKIINSHSTCFYNKTVICDIPEQYLSRYFTHVDGAIVLNEQIKKNVIFTNQNVSLDPPFSNMDMVSCRNLLIYFQPTTQKRILSYFHFSLNRDGFLLLGSSETIGALHEYYHALNMQFRVYKKNSDLRISLSQAGLRKPTISTTASAISQTNKSLSLINKKHFIPPVVSNISRIKEFLLTSYAPPSFVIDNDLNITYSFGATELYTQKIKAGLSTLNISAQLHKDLLPFVTNILKKIRNTRKPKRIENVLLLPEGIHVAIEGFCILNENSIESFVISFIDKKLLTKEQTLEELDYQRNSEFSEKISKLDADLIDAREALSESQYDVKNLSEELQCTNEELMAANEELQSSNEELHSVNEELFTVNSEYQEKIKDLEATNNDLDNVLSYIDYGVIYLNEHLIIRRFTPKAKNFVRILSLDLKRPFTDLSLTFSADNLIELIETAIQQRTTKSQVYQQTNGPDIEVSANIHINKQERIEGVVLIFKYLSS